ncbi:MAG TPA: polysaccharide biosynthesis tyrosine autokinase [Granulicella sp.]|nr:polysaccharide biosynthesis tyrosine autokinase [Granulicella sp.]
MPYPNQVLPLASAGNTEYHLRDLWKILQRRRLAVFFSVALLLLVGIAYISFAPRLYKAQAKLQVLKQDAAANLSEQGDSAAASDALDFNLSVQTQVDVLKSRNLALRVIHELKLDQSPDYQLRHDAAENGRSLEDSPKRLAYVLQKYDKRLQVESVSGTRLISVSFLDRDPRRAAQVVNQLLADFIEYNYQVRYAATSQATSFLSNELQSMKTQVEQAQQKVAELQQQSGIYGVDETNNAVNAKLEQLNSQLTTAQANRAVKESIYRLATTRSPEVLAGLIGQQGTGANTTNSPLQMLRQEQADAAANYADLNAHYGSQYPKVLQAASRLKSIQASIDNETQRLVGQATAEYKVARDQENSAAAALNSQKSVAAQMNHNATAYTVAKHDADSSRDLYEQLLKRLKEAGVLAGLRSTNLNILDSAVVPDRAAQPQSLIALGVALLLGLIVGVMAAFSAEVMDTSVRDPLQIENSMGLPVLALVPPAERSLPKAAVQSLQRSSPGSSWQYQTTARAPRSVVAESFRSLRTAILSAMPGKASKIIAITSTSEAEGKSFITFNLASAFAQSGRTVLVIDADLRKRTLTQALALDGHDGLDEAVSNPSWQSFVKTYEEVPGLFVLPAGHQEHYPADVLGSVAISELLTKLKKTFDIILIDTPSILPVTDTVSLSGSVDAVILVAKCAETAQHSLARTQSVLQRAGARVLGVVLNGIDYNSSDFYYYWGRQSDGYKVSSAQILSPAPAISVSRTVLPILLLLLATGLAHARVWAQGQTVSTAAPASAQPAAQKTVIGVGDLLTINVYDAPELNQDVRVESSGNVHLALLGDVKAVNQQPEAFAHVLEAELKKRDLIVAPHVTVAIKEFTTEGVTVEGEVQRPGMYPIFSARNIVDVIALAGGVTKDADPQITIRRSGTDAREVVDLPQTNANQVMSSDVRVYPGDTIVVPRAGLAYVMGNVVRPGGYIMHDNGKMTVLQAISEAQGLSRDASTKHVLLLRKTADGTQKIPIQLKAMMRGEIKDVPLETGDIVFVPSSGLKSFGTNTAGIFASLSGAALYTTAH